MEFQYGLLMTSVETIKEILMTEVARILKEIPRTKLFLMGPLDLFISK